MLNVQIPNVTKSNKIKMFQVTIIEILLLRSMSHMKQHCMPGMSDIQYLEKRFLLKHLTCYINNVKIPEINYMVSSIRQKNK